MLKVMVARKVNSFLPKTNDFYTQYNLHGARGYLKITIRSACTCTMYMHAKVCSEQVYMQTALGYKYMQLHGICHEELGLELTSACMLTMLLITFHN